MKKKLKSHTQLSVQKMTSRLFFFFFLKEKLSELEDALKAFEFQTAPVQKIKGLLDKIKVCLKRIFNDEFLPKRYQYQYVIIFQHSIFIRSYPYQMYDANKCTVVSHDIFSFMLIFMLYFL